jgi:8-hydroxy-5-deazaflavin:NADPH oxidoreductase
VRIGVLGTGMVGRTLAARFVELGHEVTIGTRDPESTRGRGEEPPAALATFAEAASGADLVVNAVNGGATLEVLRLAGADHLTGTVVLDASNPLDFSQGMPPTLFVKDDDSLAEQVQREFPEARVVKSLNTLNADLMAHPDLLRSPSTVFVSGDDDEAKQVVVGLLREMGHQDVLDLGDLSTARGAEMWLPLWLRIMGSLGTARFNLRVVR